MKKLIEALHVIKDECEKHEGDCAECPMSYGENGEFCSVVDNVPASWKINDEVQKALL